MGQGELGSLKAPIDEEIIMRDSRPGELLFLTGRFLKAKANGRESLENRAECLDIRTSRRRSP